MRHGEQVSRKPRSNEDHENNKIRSVAKPTPGVGVPARRSVLGRCSVAQGRVTVSMVVLVLEVPDHHPGLEQTVPVIAVEALLP